MLEVLVGLTFMAGAIVVALVLPILSFLRAQEARRITQSLSDRLAALEAAVVRLGGEQTIAVPTPAIVTETQTPAPAAAVTAPAADAPAAAAESPAEPDAEDFEQRIGSRWLLYAGIAAVVLGMSYFVKFAFDNGWVSEPLRVAIGVAIGLALVGGGMRLSARGLAWFGQALAGGGILVLYLSTYAALHFYQLIAPAPAFATMVAVTGMAAWLADRHRSQVLAVLALLGGFATPVLVGGDQDAQVVLFTYVALLVTGTALLARRHDWPLLAAGSYVCTFLLVLAWFSDAYEPSRWLRTELFLTLYVALFAVMLRALLASTDRSPQAVLSIAALATAPLVYHATSLTLLEAHPAAWLVYLVLVSVAGLAAAERTSSPAIRIVVLLLVGLPALGWLVELPYPGWLLAGVGVSVALYTLHLAAQWEATTDTEPGAALDTGQAIHTQLNGLLLPLTLYLVSEEHAPAWSVWAVTSLAAWNVAIALAARTRAPRMALQFTVLGATLTAAAIVVAFDGPAVPAGWAAEGVFLAWLAMRERSRALGWGAGTLIAVGCLGVLGLLEAPLAAGQAPLLNARTVATVMVLGLLGWLAVRMQADEAPEVRGRLRDALIVLANILGIVFLSAEIHAFYQQRAIDATANLAEQLTLSVSWALYAVALIAIGIRRRYAPARYFAIVLFGITIVKVLAHDIAGLDRVYRMLTVLGVGALLLVASYLYQRRGAARDRQETS